MAKYSRRTWPRDPSGPSRSRRRPSRYQVYFGDPLAARRFALDGEVAAQVSTVETALARLDAGVAGSAGTEAAIAPEALAHLLARLDAVASSRVEGLRVGPRRLLRAEVAQQLGEAPANPETAEILGSIDAMAWALETVSEGATISVAVLLEAHRRLLGGWELGEQAGRLRDRLTWVGGDEHDPCSADYVPPPPERIPDLLADLCAFCNGASLPPVAQAAVAHAQLEMIRPFLDGNGSIARLLAQLVLRRRGLAPRLPPPVSLVLASWPTEVLEALAGTRYEGPPSSTQAHAGFNHWVGLFAAACGRAVVHVEQLQDRVRRLQEDWRAELGASRADSAAGLLVAALPAAPVLTANTAAALIGRTFQASNQAIGRLAEAGILVQVGDGPRNRVFEAPALIDAFAVLLRRRAGSPAGTRRSPP